MTVSAINIPNYKLKLFSKKLQSGKFQVKFYASQQARDQLVPNNQVRHQTPAQTTQDQTTQHQQCGDQDMYGYVLVDAKDTLKKVVNTINQRLHLMEEANDYYHTHLYAVRKEPPPNSEFMIFKS